MKTYPPEVKAQVIAEALLGEPVKRLARKYDIPEATVRYWRDASKAQPVLAPQKQEDVGEAIYDLIIELTRGARAIARQLQDPRYLERQPANDLAISLGVSIDKLAGLAGAIARGQRQHEALTSGSDDG